MDCGGPQELRGVSRRRSRRDVERPHDRRRWEQSDKAKPFKGVDGGVFEIAIQRRGDAFRVLYAVKVGTDIWVIHAFQKKSKAGIKTPRMEVEVIRDRLRRLKEMFE